MDLDWFLDKMSFTDQDKYRSIIPSLDCEQPKFYWIFRNMEFEQWHSAGCSPVLWLSGPSKCSIREVSSYIVDSMKKTASETQSSVLYFFCSAASFPKSRSITTVFIHTLLYEIVCSSPLNRKESVVRKFLQSLIDTLLAREPPVELETLHLTEEDSLEKVIMKVLDGPTDDLWDALKITLDDAQISDLSIVIDGLDAVEPQMVTFVDEICEFLAHIQKRILKVKALVTSRLEVEIRHVFDGLIHIEYDKEGLLIY